MILCAVLRAIFLPAALVVVGCFLFELEVLGAAAAAPLPAVDALLGGAAAVDADDEAPGGT